jgi:16S rRNA (cytidine1402-2'-O)-methyltransferase
VHKKGDHLGEFDARPLLRSAVLGQAIGLISEAGMPAVADPGSSVVRAAHALGIPVVPLVGPVSLLLALAASGLNGQHFAFNGYVPVPREERSRRIRELESLALKTGQTQIFIETPYRNSSLLLALLETLAQGTRLACASALTTDQAQCRSDLVRNWKQKAWTLDNATPAVFAIGR